MSRYHVYVSYPSGASVSHGAHDFKDAVALAKEQASHGGQRTVSIVGDNYDCDCDQDGYFVSDDGLTDDERERLEEEGLL